ncbi:hypothetical protein [Acidithiobacillus ferriphilus]|uniref:hypothetical protein n=1 Tax=Acidithiobacillus ferriphilus TaxID=1689834 RepID=UPI001C079B95|nr:hypothetical protein [Acidithiobacillus ferriphilus]MBU2854403.1 hypothetical protein [Acidithiobacillus ferriphilus]
MIENLAEKRSISPVLDYYCNMSRAAATTVLDALATIVQKDPAILDTIEQAMPQGEQREAYRVWLDQYRFCPDGKVKLDQNRLGEVFSFIGHLTEHICWTDLYERERHHYVTIVNEGE